MRGTEHYHAARMRNNRLEYFRGFAAGGALAITEEPEKAYTFGSRDVALQFKREQNEKNFRDEYEDGYWFTVRITEGGR